MEPRSGPTRTQPTCRVVDPCSGSSLSALCCLFISGVVRRLETAIQAQNPLRVITVVVVRVLRLLGSPCIGLAALPGQMSH